MKLEGGRALEAALYDVATQVAKRLGAAALRNAAKPVLAAFKANTTVATGQLVESESMGTRARLNPRQKKLTPRPRSDELEIHVGTADPAGIQQEFGNRHQGAHPALTPAWESEGGQTAVDRIGRELGAGIERAAARARTSTRSV